MNSMESYLEKLKNSIIQEDYPKVKKYSKKIYNMSKNKINEVNKEINTLQDFEKEMEAIGVDMPPEEIDLGKVVEMPYVDIPPEGIDLEEEVGKVEKKLLLKALKRTNGDRKKAAELLNIPYRSIRYRLEKYGIKNGKGNLSHDS